MSELTQPDGMTIFSQYPVGEISDGYHTFDELYEFRLLYNAALFNEWHAQRKYKVHKSKLHSDSTLPFGGGWFVVVAELPTGQITNHYELQDWDKFQITETPVAHAWDGHTATDVAIRLEQFLTLPMEGVNGPREQMMASAWRRMAMIERFGTRQEIKTARAVMDDTEGQPTDEIPEATKQVHEIFFAIRDRAKQGAGL